MSCFHGYLAGNQLVFGFTLTWKGRDSFSPYCAHGMFGLLRYDFLEEGYLHRRTDYHRSLA
jgi:hypothetical protein